MIPKIKLVLLLLFSFLSYGYCIVNVFQSNSTLISTSTTTDAWVLNSQTVVTSTNIVFGGYFKGTVYFGSTSKTPTPTTASDLFLVSFNRISNDIQYLTTLGGPASDLFGGFAVDSNGDFVIASSFSGTTNYGGSSLTSSPGADSLGLVKLGSDLSYKWSFNYNGNESFIATGMAVDSNNDILVAGQFTGMVSWGGNNLYSNGLFDTIVAKFSSSGSFVWSKSFGSPGQDKFTSVATDSTKNVIPVGFFSGSPIQLGTSSVPLQGSYDPLILKLDSAGNFLWYKTYSSNGTTTVSNVATDSLDNIYVAGSFNSYVNLGGTTMSTQTGDTFVAKLQSDSTFTWQQKLNTYSLATSVATNGYDSTVLISGYYTGLGTVGQVTLPNTTHGAAYAVKFASDGSSLWGASYAMNSGSIWNIEAASFPNSNYSTISVSYTTTIQDLNNQTCADNGALTSVLAILEEAGVLAPSPSPSSGAPSASASPAPGTSVSPSAIPSSGPSASSSPSTDTSDANHLHSLLHVVFALLILCQQ